MRLESVVGRFEARWLKTSTIQLAIRHLVSERQLLAEEEMNLLSWFVAADAARICFVDIRHGVFFDLCFWNFPELYLVVVPNEESSFVEVDVVVEGIVYWVSYPLNEVVLHINYVKAI